MVYLFLDTFHRLLETLFTVVVCYTQWERKPALKTTTKCVSIGFKMFYLLFTVKIVIVEIMYFHSG